MKKLNRKGSVHPSPPILPDQLAFLPTSIFALAAALSPEDREVLAYLISCCSNPSANSPFVSSSGNQRSKAPKKKGGSGLEVSGDHPPLFHCNCFRCYMSHWVRWDASPNRHLIHEIIDAFEDWWAKNNKPGGAFKNSRKERRNKKGSNKKDGQASDGSLMIGSNTGKEELVGSESKVESRNHDDPDSHEGEQKGSVRRFVDYIGERVWGVWGQ